ncbi:ribosomal RNA processing protein 36 homolog [Heteronotia binoei]|uniref:ribosomal RNA processing protein 36 homolog n=1 Tax=Heteronotia binoei TaxID=13085 RepID=UPI0029316A85|nr:ribosomal RNA processing protein 36 homolog [Heteronotia binoei]XP_060104061.1 ribosomal RNA processing protein 36 homolog [Heteronotia binoei]
MKQLRGNKSGGHPQKKRSSDKAICTPAVQTSEESREVTTLIPQMLAQKRSLQGLSGTIGGTGESTNDAKRPKLLPSANSTGQESEDDDSDDSDFERVENDNDISDETSSDDDEDDDNDEVGSDSSRSSNGDSDSEDTTSSPLSKPELTKELSSVSFEELLKLRNTVGTKAYQRMAIEKTAKNTTKLKRRQSSNKHSPLELSAKKPVPFLRQVVPVKKKVPRDPRFDDLSGEYNPEVFEKTYAFLNDHRKKEKEMVQKQLKKCRNAEQQNKLQQLLKRMTQQEDAQKKREKEREKDLALKKQQRELAKQGKKPFYLKKSDKQKLELAEKYKELKKSGKLENFLSKKRKRNAAKDKRKLPSRKNL